MDLLSKDALKNTIIFSYLIVLLLSCSSNTEPATFDDFELVSVEPVQYEMDSILEVESYVKLKGLFRIQFIADSLESELENTEFLKQTYLEEKHHLSLEGVDSAYFIFEKFLKTINISPEDDKALYEYDDLKESEISFYYADFGINIESAEGEYYTVPNYHYLYDLFKNDMSLDSKKYAEFLMLSGKPIFDDGGLKISWMDLAIQILETEEHYRNVKYSEYAGPVLTEYVYLAHILMYGSEKSMIIESKDSVRSFLPEVNEVYQFLIEDDSLHNSCHIFKLHLNNLKEVNFDLTDERLVRIPKGEIKKILLFVTPAEKYDQSAEYNREFGK